MKKLFIHNLLFRLVGPVFIGLVIYLLILLINNSIAQLDEFFASTEVYLCIVLVYLILELVRFAMILVERRAEKWTFSKQVLAQFLVAMACMAFVVYMVVEAYFSRVLGYNPSAAEFNIFLGIYGFMVMMYLTLHFSHLFLYKENKMKFEEEEILKESLEFEFRNFKRGMNPNLLLESLESLIAISDEQIDSADELIDELSVVYRYILSSNRSELAALQEELTAVQHLINLFWYQGIDVDFKQNASGEALCVPGTLLTIVEWLIRASIHSSMQSLEVEIVIHEDDLVLVSTRKEKLSPPVLDIADIERAYEFYTEKKIRFSSDAEITEIRIPILIPTEPEMA